MKTLFKLKKYPSVREEKAFPEYMLQKGYQEGRIETSSYYIHVPNTLPSNGKKLEFAQWLDLYSLRVV